MSNSQGWNRYSYVQNRPVTMNDPTGHTACFGENADDGPQCYKEGIINNKGHNQPMGNKAKIHGCGSYDDKCLLNYRNNEKFIGPTPTYIGGQPTDDPIKTGIQGVGYWIKGGKFLFDLLNVIGNYGTPVYRQAKGLGNAGPWVEGIASFLLQGAEDYDNPSFTTVQKFTRAAVVGSEDALTELASEPIATWATVKGGVVGAGIGAELGGFPGGFAGGLTGATAGYLLANIGTNIVMNAGWSWANHYFAPKLFP